MHWRQYCAGEDRVVLTIVWHGIHIARGGRGNIDVGGDRDLIHARHAWSGHAVMTVVIDDARPTKSARLGASVIAFPCFQTPVECRQKNECEAIILRFFACPWGRGIRYP